MALDTTIGGTSADSYATLAEYQAYGAAQGWTLAGTDAADEVNLRRSAAYIDRNHSFIGMQQYQFQARDWPRLVNQLVDDWPIDPDTVPQAIKDAQCELAYLIQGGLDPFATVEGVVRSEGSEVGPVKESITYAGGKARPRLVAIEGLLRPYLATGAGQSRMVRA